MSQPMPDPARNIHQLLAFYLEAGVDCALARSVTRMPKHSETMSEKLISPAAIR